MIVIFNCGSSPDCKLNVKPKCGLKIEIYNPQAFGQRDLPSPMPLAVHTRIEVPLGADIHAYHCSWSYQDFIRKSSLLPSSSSLKVIFDACTIRKSFNCSFGLSSHFKSHLRFDSCAWLSRLHWSLYFTFLVFEQSFIQTIREEVEFCFHLILLSFLPDPCNLYPTSNQDMISVIHDSLTTHLRLMLIIQIDVDTRWARDDCERE